MSDEVLLYDPVEGNTFLLPLKTLSSDNTKILLPPQKEEVLFSLVPQIPNMRDIRGVYESRNKLYISIETFLNCNLSCPYCYQTNNNHSKTVVTKGNLDLLYDYIVAVYDIYQFDILNFKILGGEPSINWAPSKYILQKLFPFCKQNNVHLDLYVDTNGTIIKDLLHITEYDTLTFNVPLCFEGCHNKYRVFNNQEGTYRTIIDNVNALSMLPNTKVLLRHNTDSQNITFFGEFLNDLTNTLSFNPVIMPFYTTEPIYGSFKNSLPYFDYIDWKSSVCIEELINHGFDVAFSPRTYKEGECQQLSKYSLKLFSNGKIGACAVNFFDEDNPYLSDLLPDNLNRLNRYWGGEKGIKVFRDRQKCLNCKSLFSCLGDYHLPCIKKLGITQCNPDRNVYLNFNYYFSKLYSFHLKGMSEKFNSVKLYDLR